MEKRLIIILAMTVSLFILGGCAARNTYFDVPNRALHVPDYFEETYQAIQKAEQSEGAKNCPEKIDQAKDLASEGAKVYWTCHDKEAEAKMAQARALASEAEQCRPAPAVKPPAPKPSPAPPPRIKLNNKVIAGAFNFDHITLNPAAREVLAEQAKMIQQDPEATIDIYGYTDSIGTETYNFQLSIRRAVSARDYLIGLGVPAGRIRIHGMGEKDPIATNSTPEGRAENRRVEIKYRQ